MQTIPPGTMKIKSEHPESQGEFVLIEAKDFDADIHEEFDAKPVGKKTGIASQAPMPSTNPFGPAK